MCGQLADARQGQFHRVVRLARAGLACPGEALEDHPVLPHALAAEDDVGLQHLAGARIIHAAAIRPAARLPVRPLDHIVAHVERMDALRQHLYAIGIREARRREGIGPPGCAFDQRLTDLLRCTGINIEDQRLLCRAARGCRVLLFQPEAARERLAHLSRERCRKIIEADINRPATRIEHAGLVAVVRQAHERLVLHQREGTPVGRRGANLRFRVVACQCQEGIELGIIGKGQRLRRVRHGPVFGNCKVASVRTGLQDAAHVQRVACQEARKVDQQRAVLRFRNDVARPDE